MDVSIVIPNWNGRSLLEKNLPQVIKAKKNKRNSIREIIVIDDKSTDDSLLFLRKNFAGEIKVIAHKENRGFSATVNTGARASKGELIALINTDVLPEENFLEEVLPHFKEEKVFALSLHERGLGWSRGKFEDGFIVHEGQPESSVVHNTFWVSGGSGIFRRDIWMQLGGLDEKLFSPFYWEDLDISYRAMKRGYKLLWEPDSLVEHEHESTTSKLPRKKLQRIQERNQLILVWKNLTSQNLTRKHLVGLIKRIIKAPGYIRIVLMALSKLPQIMRARRKEVKESKISDETIFSTFSK